MIRKIAFLAVMGLMFATSSVLPDDSTKETAAIHSAEKWLAIVDDENYAESWSQASELFKHAVQSDQWVQSLLAVRKPLGKLISRKLKTTAYKTTLPGAPDGEYVAIQFESSYENKKSAIETVTPMMDEDGVWRVSGYYIK